MTETTAGFKELYKLFIELPKATQRTTLRRIAAKRLKPIADAARAMAPRGTRPLTGGAKKRGRLFRSIKVGSKLSRRQASMAPDTAIGDVVMHVGAGSMPQAHLAEFGLGHNPVHPYMRPAWDAERTSIVDKLGEDLWNEIAAQVAKRQQ